jgi:hypothetical protein
MTEQPPRPADPRRYTDLQLELRDLDARTGCYKVSLRGALGEFDGVARLAEDELADPLAELADGGIEEDEDRIVFGQALADRLLPDGDVRTQVTEAIRRAGTDAGVRLRLVTREPRLARLPWEYTYLSLLNREDLADFLVLNPMVSLVRHEQLPLPQSELHADGPAELRLLAVTANAPGYPELDLQREREALETALARLPVDLPRLTYQPVLENPTAGELQGALTRRADLFHFAGHGGAGYLALPPAEGGPGELSADRLGRLLQAAGVRLAVLGACDSGRRGRSQWAGVVPALVAVAAIPAVVAMQYPVRNSAAVMFASAFYTAIAAGLSVDEAVWSGRLRLQDPDDLSASWGIPVLYLRSPDGVLFRRLAERPSATASKLRSIVDERAQSVQRGAVTGIDAPDAEAMPPSAADLDGLGEEQIRLLRISATVLSYLIGSLVELDDPPPSADLAEVSARWRASLNRAKEQLDALKRRVTVNKWPHEDWAITFGSARYQVQLDIRAIQGHPDRPAIFRPVITSERERRLRSHVATLLRLLQERYPSLFPHGPTAGTLPAGRADQGGAATDACYEPTRTADEQPDGVLATLGQSPSFETVTRVLETVNNLNGLAGGIATVQGGTDDPAGDALSMRVRFLWGTSPSAPEPALLIQAVSQVNERYYFNHLELQRDSEIIGNDDRLYTETFWEPGQPPDDVGSRLITGLMGEGAFQGKETLDWDKALAELARTLGVVLTSRKGEVRWPMAQLFELIGDDWAITTAGVEYRTELRPVFFPEQFPSWGSGQQTDGHIGEFSWRPPEVPAGIPPPSERLWQRASAYLPLRDIPTTPAGWRPVTKRPGPV